MHRLSQIFLPILALGLLAGCDDSSSSQAKQDRQAEAYAASMGVDAKVKTNADGTRNVAVNHNLGAMGGMKAQTGNNLSLPAGFPSDVPIYSGMKIQSAVEMPQLGFMVQGQAPDGSDAIADFYRAQMLANGWTDATPATQSPAMRQLAFKKGERNAGINLIPSGTGTMVQLSAARQG